MYKMIETYCKFIRRGRQDSTIEQIGEKLTRIFHQLEEEHEVELLPYQIKGLDATVLVEWYAEMEDNELKTGTLNNYVVILNPFLRWAATMDKDGVPYIYKDLSKVLTTRKLEKEDHSEKYLTPEQVNALLTTTYGKCLERDRAIVALILGSGLRVSEVCSLKIGDLMEEDKKGEVHVKRKGGEWKDTEMADFVYGYVDSYLEVRRDCWDDNGELMMDRPLFVTTHGNPCNRKTIFGSLSFKQKHLGQPTGPHVLRHTFVSASEKIGGGAVARDLANHSSLTITNLYDHSTQQERRNTVNALPWANAVSAN